MHSLVVTLVPVPQAESFGWTGLQGKHMASGSAAGTLAFCQRVTFCCLFQISKIHVLFT
jgi:hypothetical protein